MLTSLLTAAHVGGKIARGTVKPLQGEGQLSDAISRATSKSLIEYTQSTRVEPIVLLDQTAVQLPYIEDVLKVVNSVFAAYYLQAVALSVNVGRVDTVRLLERLNPQRSVTNAAATLIGDVFSGAMDAVSMSGMMALAGNAFIDFPKQWDDSQVTVPTANFTIEARSAYGTPMASFLNLYT